YDGRHDVNAYTVTPSSYEVTVAITMHTHGDEKFNPAGFFALLSEISKPRPKQAFLQWLSNSVRWIIVPFVFAVAYIADTRFTNGVNPNRNFDYLWEFNPNNDKGAYPNSEIEVQNIINYFTPLRDQVDYHIDLHDVPGPAGAAYSHRPF